MIISLTGFMACGKSSVGRKLADLIGAEFTDLDEVVAGSEGRSIAEIFAASGEEYFRERELECVEKLIEEYSEGDSYSSCRSAKDLVLALGGGTFCTEKAQKLLLSKSLCCYLKADFNTLRSRLQSGSSASLRTEDNSETLCYESRPLWANAGQLYAQRISQYEKAHLTIETDGLSVEEVAGETHKRIQGFLAASRR